MSSDKKGTEKKNSGTGKGTGTKTSAAKSTASVSRSRSSSGKAATLKETPKRAPKRGPRQEAALEQEEVQVKEKRELTKEEQSVRNEIILTVTALVSVLLVLTFFGLGGPVGVFMNQLLFGTMGALAFIFPLLLFFFVAFYLSNHGNPVASRKMLAGIAFLILLCSLLQMIFGLVDGLRFFDYYNYCAEHKNGGGILGAIIAVPFDKAFGKAATIIIIAAFMIIFLMILTGKALFALLKKEGKAQIERARERNQAINEYYERMTEEELEEEEAERQHMQFVTLGETVEKPVEQKKKRSFLDTIRELGNPEYESRPKTQNTESIRSLVDNEHIFLQEDIELREQGREMTYEELSVGNTANEGKKTAGKKTAESTAKPEKKPASLFEGYTIKGALEEDPVPSPTDMKEITPKRTGSVHISTDADYKEATVLAGSATSSDDRGFADGPARPAQKSAKATDMREVTAKPADKADKVKADPALNEETAAQIDASLISQEVPKEYVFPPITLLNEAKGKNGGVSKKEVEKNAELLTSTLESFGVHVKLLNVSCGPTVTRYELSPEQGVKVSSITKLENDIKLNLAAADIRIEAPIPGKAAIGIEVPNKENSTVSIRELIESEEFKKKSGGITFAVGKDISGECIVTDISKMPHLLIAGATGSGKSVCINTLIMSILYKYKPEDIRLIMIDPKMVELGVYNGIPQLLIPVVTDPKKAAASLNWAVMEMTRRYEKFAEAHVRDLKGYNAYIEAEKKKPENREAVAENPENFQKMPQIVIIVDELADLMMVAPGEVENAIIRLSQLARAAGMHLVIATQRPSVNVITGLIKANMPSRIALAVTSGVDSRTILDAGGAEKLLGKGDMLFAPMNLPKPIRVQGAFVSDGEVERVVEFIKEENTEAEYSEEVTSTINSMNISGGKTANPVDTSEASSSPDGDEYLVEAGRLIIEKQKASIGMLQRVYRIGFNRAARIVDTLSDMGVLGPENGTKSREILMTKEQFEEYVNNNLK